MNRLIKIAILTSLSAISINNAMAITAKKNKKSTADDGYIELGYGVYAPTGVTANATCINVGSTKFSSFQNSISFYHPVSQQQLKQYLNLSIDGKGGWSSFVASGTASFVSSTKDDNYSRNFNYVQDTSSQVSFDLPSWGIDNLKPVYQNAYNQSPQSFLTYCGDSFVNRASAGALLAVNTKVVFSNNADKKVFDRLIDANVGLTNLTTAIKNSGISSSVNARIQFSFMQGGGQPDNLAKIFSTTPTDGHYVTGCSFNNLTACDQIISSIINYTNSLSSQIRDASGNILPDRLFYYNPSIVSYYNIGIGNQTTPLSADVENAQNTLVDTLDQTNLDLSFVNHYSSSDMAKYFYADMRTFLADTATALNNRVRYLKNVGGKCFSTAEASQCTQIVADMQKDFSTNASYIVDEDAFNFVKTSYRQDANIVHIVPLTFNIAIPNNYYYGGGIMTINFTNNWNNFYYIMGVGDHGNLVSVDTSHTAYAGTKYWNDGSHPSYTTFYRDTNPY